MQIIRIEFPSNYRLIPAFMGITIEEKFLISQLYNILGLVNAQRLEFFPLLSEKL